MSEKLLEIKNLHVMYKTDEDDVYALNGLTWSWIRARPWDWWGRPERERPPSPSVS